MVAKVRGTADLPLSIRGKADLATEADKIRQKGGFDLILSSPLYRSRMTAKAILAASPAGAKMMIMPGLIPQSQGSLEGTPKDQAQDTLRDYEDNKIDEPLPGVSKYTGKPGESSRTARERFLSEGLIPAMKMAKANPQLRVLAMTHSSNIKIARGWDENGRPDDLTIAPKAMHEETEWPTGIVAMEDKGVRSVDMDKPGRIEPGKLYLGRHAETPWGG